MSLNVHIGNRESVPFRIDSEGGSLKLPAIYIEPADINQQAASIKAIRVRMQGDPLGLVVLGPAYATQTDLKVFEKPHKLTQRIECLPYSINLKAQDFPAGQYLMRAEVVYQQPPPFPGAKPGKETVAFTERYLEVPGDLGRQCVVKAGWRHQELTVGVNVAELIIHAENLPRSAAPTVSVHDPNDVVIPALRDALNHQFALAPPTLLREQKGASPAVFQQKISFRFDAPERAAAIRQAPLRVELRVAVTKVGRGEPRELASVTLAGKHALVVDFPENMFPGYPILDLGTSSTFALIYFFQLQTGLLPVEQEQTVRASLSRWLDRKDGPFALPEWKAVLANTARQLGDTDRGSADPAASVRNYLKRNPPRPFHTDQGVHRALKALELSAMAPNLSVPFRLGLRRELAEMYARAFHRFPLQQQRLVAVELDSSSAAAPDLEGAIVAPIPSTAAVTSLKPFALDIGHTAETARQAAGVANPASLLTQFHSSPKNYYALLGQAGARVEVSVNGHVESVAPRTFLVAAFKRLRERIESFRDNAEHLPKKRFSKIVMPFPTSAPLSVRQELLAAARDAGFDRPIADLDEALSAIVFYLVNPFGADLEMGLESFRTSCRPTPRGALPPIEWKQNVLLIDVGGGTTDIALIEVRLEDAQARGAGDGSKGRYYRLTPKLLGATGKGQLAGNVLSLGVFHEVKRRIADAVLTALATMTPAAVAPAAATAPAAASRSARAAQVAQETTNLDRLLQIVSTIPSPFRDDSGARYRPGALLDHYLIHQLWLDKGDLLAPAAFRLANDVMPTTWKSIADESARSAAARSFHLLWQIAEGIKKSVFGGTTPESALGATVPIEQIAALLGISVAACQQFGMGPIVIGREEFWASIDLPLREIAKLALDLTVNSLPNAADGKAILDRIVLTGQTCRLSRVREVVKEVFQTECDSKIARLTWDPTCLTFEGEYAKQAAALGAAYAQLLREDRVPPNADHALNGNVLDIDIQNLFFFLQSGFYVRRAHARGKETVLIPGQSFREFDQDGVGHIRSEWLVEPSEMLYIDRFDFASDAGMPWGHYDCKMLVDQLAVPLQQFQEHIRVAIEADHRLVVSVLFCSGSERHYELPAAGEIIDVADVLRQLRVIPMTVQLAGEMSAPPPLPGEWMQTLSGWVVGINVHSGFRNDSVFRLAPAEFTKTLRHSTDKSRRRGAESVDLPPCPESGVDKFYVRPNDHSREWIQIGELIRPTMTSSRRVATRAVLDDVGHLRVVLGELPLYFARNDKELLDPGVVLRKPLTSSTIAPDDLRDPFCGRH